MDVPVEAEAKQTREQPTHQHANAQVVPQRQALSKYPTANTRQDYEWIKQTHKHTQQDKYISGSVSNITYEPDKHADGVGNQEGVIQVTKQCLVVVLV